MRRRMRTHTRSAACIAAAMLAVAGLPSSAQGQDCPDFPARYTKGRPSKNFYRIPYADGEQVIMSQDYFTHGGGMDMNALSPPAFLVAPADGIICQAVDSLDDCGCAGPTHDIAPCANKLSIVHANGEMSGYLHMQQFSIRDAFGVADPSEIIGMPVVQGQIIGIEGDVGRTCHPDGSDPRWGTCITEAQAADLGPCGRHVHWAVWRISTGELLQPMTCNVLWNIYADDQTYTAASCPTSPYCIANAVNLPTTTLDGLGNTRVYQNNDAITASAFVVRNSASVVFRARNKIRLLPGFKAGAGDAYFRAEIGLCNTTSPNP